MNTLLDLYESQHPGVKISREYSNFADYWVKFNTQAAAGTQPDVSLHVMQSVQEYVNKGVLLPLDEYVQSGRINIADWSNAAISPGIINGKQYGIIYGLTPQGVLYNAALIAGAGLPPPPQNWTVEQFKAYVLELKDKLPQGVWAVESAADSDHAIEIFMRSKGKSFYTAEGTGLGFAKQDLIDWFTLWDDLRKAGAVPGAVLSAELRNAPYEQTLFGSGKAALLFQNANLIPTFQSIVAGEVLITREPRVNPNIPGDFFQPTMFGVSAKTKYPAESAEFIDWMVNNLEANLIFKADYGAPGDPDALKAIQGAATAVENRSYSFDKLLLEDKTIPPSRARAEGSSSVFDPCLRLAYEDISSGAITLNAGVDRFFQEAEAILSKNKPNR
jgi:multiple sugar transport system substrate-binding protein